MPTMPWELILSNIREAREQLEEIEIALASDSPPHEVTFQCMMQHAYHHLNFAWNMRNSTAERYVNLSEDDFNRWGSMPTDLATDYD